MTQAVILIEDLPQAAMDAAAQFHAQQFARLADAIGEGVQAVAIVVPMAGHDHADWRRAVTRDLARQHAPVRINMVSGSNPERSNAVLAYLRDAPGITGQYLVAHDESS